MIGNVVQEGGDNRPIVQLSAGDSDLGYKSKIIFAHNTLFNVANGLSLGGNDTISVGGNIIDGISQNSSSQHIRFSGPVDSPWNLNYSLFGGPGTKAKIGWGTSVSRDVVTLGQDYSGQCAGCLETSPQFVNAPFSSGWVDTFFKATYSNAEMTEINRTGVPDSARIRTTLRVPGQDFSAVGIRIGDHVKMNSGTGVVTSLLSTDNPNLKIGAINGDTLTLNRDITLSPSSDVSFSVSYYPTTRTDVYLADVSGFAVGDKVEFGNDNVARTVSAITADSKGSKIVFFPPTPDPIYPYRFLSNWKQNTRVVEDFRVKSASLAENASIEGNYYALFESLYGIDIRKDFDGKIRPRGSQWDIGAFERS